MDLSNRFLWRAGSKLSKLRRNLLNHLLRDFPGEIQAGELTISNLQPLGGYFQPGITKAGRLSFRGKIEGRDVKVYSSFGEGQSQLRRLLQSIDNEFFCFPELIYSDSQLIVEEWVSGESFVNFSAIKQKEIAERLSGFISSLHGYPARSDSFELSGNGSFCYLEDYLLGRVKLWEHWAPVRSFIRRWEEKYASHNDSVPSAASHPDLTIRNLIVGKKSGRIHVIDNELINFGRGWVLDGRNSLLNHDVGTDSVPSEFIEMTWRLRLLGSALDSSDYFLANELCKDAV